MTRSLFTRRQAGGLLAALPLTLSVSDAFGFAGPEHADRLRRHLADIALRWPNAQLKLIRLELVPDEGQAVAAKAVVRLIWPPGMRQRPFVVVADTPDLAIDQLSEQIRAYLDVL